MFFKSLVERLHYKFWPQGTVIEMFDGYVDAIRDDIAYVQLTSRANQDVLHGQYSAKKLADIGVQEQDPFLVSSIGRGTTVEVVIEKAEQL